jgi:pimeloyl-ACP methyl ester carboxylesterase
MIGREDVQRAAEEAQAVSAATEEGEQVVQVDGIATHYLVAGPTNAPHVVFVHGLGGSLTTWSLNMPAFAEKFRICALDLVGAGNSDKPTGADYSVTALTDFLAHFLDALGPEWQKVSLIGHSLGGAVILAFASRYPERVQRLVLVDTAGLGPEIDTTVLDLMREEPTPEHIRAELLHFFANPALVQQALVEQIYEQRKQPDTRAALLATIDAAFGGGRQRTDLRETLASVPHPTLIIWGDLDSVIPVAHSQAAKQAPQSQLEIFTNCGHCPHIERGDAFNQRVMDFLSENKA